jgi:hypothetical protein
MPPTNRVVSGTATYMGVLPHQNRVRGPRALASGLADPVAQGWLRDSCRPSFERMQGHAGKDWSLKRRHLGVSLLEH